MHARAQTLDGPSAAKLLQLRGNHGGFEMALRARRRLANLQSDRLAVEVTNTSRPEIQHWAYSHIDGPTAEFASNKTRLKAWKRPRLPFASLMSPRGSVSVDLDCACTGANTLPRQELLRTVFQLE